MLAKYAGLWVVWLGERMDELFIRSMAFSTATTQFSFRPEEPPFLVVGRTTRSLGGVLPVLGLPVELDSGLGLFVTNVARRAETR
jgi:hypothetical protein